MRYSIDTMPHDVYGNVYYKATIEGRRNVYTAYKAGKEHHVDETKWTFFGGYKTVSFDTFEEARDYARNMGFVVPDTAPAPTQYATVNISIEHPEAKEFIQLTDALQEQLEATATKIYVRFGNLPKNGKSYNYRDNHYETGVSVFNALLLPNGQVIVKPSTNYELGSLFTLMNRDVYVVAGDVIGTGSDGEPLLKNAKIMRKLTPSDFYKFDRAKLFSEKG